MASSTACFALSTPSRSSSSTRQIVSQIKPTQLVIRAQKQTSEDSGEAGPVVSRRLALSVLIGAAAIGSRVSPADAAYGEAANVFGKPKKNTEFIPINQDDFKLVVPSKWNPSKEREFPGQVLRYEDNFDATSNVSVMITPTTKKSISDFGSPDQFLAQVFDHTILFRCWLNLESDFVSGGLSTGETSYFGNTDFEGGFDSGSVATANILESSTQTINEKEYYNISVLTRTADGDEGGKHQLITAVVSDGKLYICKAQAGDKRWFKGAKKFVEGTASSFNVA